MKTNEVTTYVSVYPLSGNLPALITEYAVGGVSFVALPDCITGNVDNMWEPLEMDTVWMPY